MINLIKCFISQKNVKAGTNPLPSEYKEDLVNEFNVKIKFWHFCFRLTLITFVEKLLNNSFCPER